MKVQKITRERAGQRLWAAGALIFLLLIPLCCKLPLGEKESLLSADLTVSFTSAAGPAAEGVRTRTIVPREELGITSITVTVTHPGGTATGTAASAGDMCTIADITPGAITIEATATDGVDTVAIGSAVLDLDPGAAESVSVDLAPTGSGSGDFSFTMIWPESTGAAFVECSLKTTAGVEVDAQSSPDPAAPSGGNYTWTYAGTSVASDSYDLFITFRTAAGGSVLGVFVESVNIYDNLTSDTWIDHDGNHQPARTFTAAEMKSSLCTLSKLVVTGAGFSNEYTAATVPPLAAGSTIVMGKKAAASIGFVPTLTDTEGGQRISYTWNGGPSVTIESGISSGQLTLADGAGGNMLEITVTAPTGETALYTVTVIKAYSLSYRGNGAVAGEVPPAALYYSGETVTASANIGGLIRPDYGWKGWSEDPGAVAPTFIGGDEFAMGPSDISLYVFWEAFGTPANLSVTDEATWLGVQWDAVAGAAGYFVERAKDYGGTTPVYTRIADVAGTSYEESNASPFMYNRYRIQAYNTVGGTSYYSDAVSIIRAEDWEDGAWLDTWVDDRTTGDSVSVSTTYCIPPGTRSLRIIDNAGWEYFDGLHYEFPGGIRPEYISFYIRKSWDDSCQPWINIGDDNTSVNYGAIWFEWDGTEDFTGNMRVIGGTDVYAAGTAFHFVEFRNIDFTAQTFDFYVDGGLITAVVPFNSPVTSFTRFYISVGWWAQSAYIDRINIQY